MKHVDVDSDVIHFIGYNEDTRTLDVRFHGTGTYRSWDIKPDAVDEFLDAGSRGESFNKYIGVHVCSTAR